jgi:hypothetical protein
MEAFAGVIAILAIVFAVLAFLLPIFVAAISSRMWQLVQESKAQTEALRNIRSELYRSNELSRQLLRSYGHEPQS